LLDAEMNSGSEAIGVFKPFINDTRLFVLDASGKTNEYSEKIDEGIDIKDLIEPGQTQHWEIDFDQYHTPKINGPYTIWVSVNGYQTQKIKPERIEESPSAPSDYSDPATGLKK
jgi:hypothetical protein